MIKRVIISNKMSFEIFVKCCLEYTFRLYVDSASCGIIDVVQAVKAIFS